MQYLQRRALVFSVNQSSITKRVEFSAAPLSVIITRSKCHCFFPMFPTLNPPCVTAVFWPPAHVTASSLHAPEANITLPGFLSRQLQCNQIEVQPGNMDSRPPHFPDLNTSGSHRLCGWGEEGVARSMFVWTKNGSGFQLQPLHTPAWLSASERRVLLLCHLRRNASCGSAADVCVCVCVCV